MSCRELANFNSACSCPCTLVSAHCTCYSSVFVVSLSCVVSVQMFEKWDTSACCLTQKAKGSRWLYESRAQRHCNTSPMYLTLPNILVDVLSSGHRVYSYQLHTPLHVTILRGYFADIITADITAGQRN